MARRHMRQGLCAALAIVIKPRAPPSPLSLCLSRAPLGQTRRTQPPRHRLSMHRARGGCGSSARPGSWSLVHLLRPSAPNAHTLTATCPRWGCEETFACSAHASGLLPRHSTRPAVFRSHLDDEGSTLHVSHVVLAAAAMRAHSVIPMQEACLRASNASRSTSLARAEQAR